MVAYNVLVCSGFLIFVCVCVYLSKEVSGKREYRIKKKCYLGLWIDELCDGNIDIIVIYIIYIWSISKCASILYMDM